MKSTRLLTALLAVALLATPAWALGNGPYSGASNPGSIHMPNGATGATGPGSNPGSSHRSPRAKAYGLLCQGESNRHVAGAKGTPFSQCVTAMAKLASGAATNPAKACARESKRHVAGTRGTPFSRCVSAAAKLLGSEAPPTGSTGPTGPTGATGPTGP